MNRRVVATMILLGAPGTPLHASFLSGPKTVEELQKKIDEIPPERNYRTRSVLLSELGTQLYKQARWDEAVEAFDSSLGYAPPTVLKKHIYLYMGKSYESAGRIDKAMSAYEQAVVFDRRNWRRHRDLARLYETANLRDKAISSYEKALKYNSREPSVHFAVGRLYRMNSLLEKAEKNFVSALDHGYNQTNVFRELSLVFEAQGKFNEAAMASKETLKESSAPEEWARLVYLSLLARQPELANEGMAALKKKNVGAETIRFYEALQTYISGRDINNGPLNALFKETLQ